MAIWLRVNKAENLHDRLVIALFLECWTWKSLFPVDYVPNIFTTQYTHTLHSAIWLKMAFRFENHFDSQNERHKQKHATHKAILWNTWMHHSGKKER